MIMDRSNKSFQKQFMLHEKAPGISRGFYILSQIAKLVAPQILLVIKHFLFDPFSFE